MLIGIDARPLEQNQTGVGRYLNNLLENWACSTRHRFVLYFKDRIPAIGILAKPCYEKKIIKAPLGISSNAVFQHWLLPREAKKDKIDLLFSPAYLLPIGYKEKTAVTIHDISYEIFPENLSLADRLLLRKISRISAKKATAILTVSNFSKKEIVEYYGVPAGKIFITPLGADRKFLDAKKSRRCETIAAKFHIRNKFILSIGTIFNRRHTENLISAFAAMAEQTGNYQLVIIGKNHTKPFIDINKKINTVNAKLKRSAILHYGSVPGDDLAALYAAAKIMIYLSDYEGFGLPPLEAALAETPVITSDIPAIREVMGDAAIFIKNNADIDEIKKAIIKIISDDDFRNKLTRRGLERAKLFSWSDCAEKTIGVFESI